MSLVVVCKNTDTRTYQYIREIDGIEGVEIVDTLNHYGEGPFSILIKTPSQDVIDKIFQLSWVEEIKEYKPLTFTIVRD